MKYFIENIETQEWLTYVRAYTGKFWTKDPNEAHSFDRKSEVYKFLENGGISYDGFNPIEEIRVEVTEHEFVDNGKD